MPQSDLQGRLLLKARCVREATKQKKQQCLLRVHAILRLIKDNRLRAVKYSVRYFGIAPCRKAMHEHRFGARLLHQGFIYLEGSENGCALR